MLTLVREVRDLPMAIGGRPAGERLERMRRSRQYRDGKFHNGGLAGAVSAGAMPAGVIAAGAVPTSRTRGDLARELFRDRELRRPPGAIPITSPPATALAAPPLQGLRLTWLGHATVLLEIEGRRVLFDPLWSRRCSPSSLIGPRRLHPVPMRLRDLPPLDAVVISHDHYDHLDMHTVRRLAALQPAPFIVPLGVGAHLERWGVRRMVELDWGEQAEIAGLQLTATAARHFSGRLKQDNSTLWASWVVAGPNRRVFYTGDSGYFDGYAAIGTEHGPFDATLVQVGAYSPYWPDIHMTPEEGVAAHLAVRGGLLVPVHWCTFVLALHSWAEPVERLRAESAARGVDVAVPRPGQLVDLDAVPRLDGWWRGLG